MIRIEVEATEKTIIDWNTQLKGSMPIYRDFRDVETVEKVVKYVMSLFASKKFHDVSVSFIYDNDSIYGKTTGRLFNICNGGKVTELHWYGDSSTADTKIELEKLTKKIIKDMYLECVERFKEYENRVA